MKSIKEMKTIKELKEMNQQQLNQYADELRLDLMNHRFMRSQNALTKNHLIKKTRKDIARCLTLMNQNRLQKETS